MDLRLKNGDLCLSSGAFSTVKGIDEAAQRAYIACTVKKNSFIYDRALGADTDHVDRTSPDAERALQMALREAIFAVPDTKLTVKSIRNINGSAVAFITIERHGETREIEVNPYGEL